MPDLETEPHTVEAALDSARLAFREYSDSLADVSKAVADLIIEQGGTTPNREPFLLALHGYHPDSAPDGWVPAAVEAYDKLEEYFGVNSLGKMVAKMATPFESPDRLQVQRIGFVPNVGQPYAGVKPSPLRYEVYRDGYRLKGRVLLPVTDLHEWGLDDVHRTPESLFTLAYVTANPTYVHVESRVDGLFVGFEDIYGARKLGSSWALERAEDRLFLERLAVAEDHFDFEH